jgi:hypothetical protein
MSNSGLTNRPPGQQPTKASRIYKKTIDGGVGNVSDVHFKVEIHPGRVQPFGGYTFGNLFWELNWFRARISYQLVCDTIQMAAMYVHIHA